MKTHPVLLLTLAAALTVPLTAQAQSTPKVHAAHAKMAAAAMYECSICHHKVNAALAKKLHYTCPDDHGKLIPVKTASLHKPH